MFKLLNTLPFLLCMPIIISSDIKSCMHPCHEGNLHYLFHDINILVNVRIMRCLKSFFFICLMRKRTEIIYQMFRVWIKTSYLVPVTRFPAHSDHCIVVCFSLSILSIICQSKLEHCLDRYIDWAHLEPPPPLKEEMYL